MTVFRRSNGNVAAKEKAGLSASQNRPFELIPAVTYVPTQLPVQYHRLSEA